MIMARIFSCGMSELVLCGQRASSQAGIDP